MKHIYSAIFVVILFSFIKCKSLLQQQQPVDRGKPSHRALSFDIINYVNYFANTTWKAGPTKRFKTVNEVKRTLGVLPYVKKSMLPVYIGSQYGVQLPQTFDAREEWQECQMIGEIRDQGDCGSCWALAAVGAISDRICIHSNGTRQFYISAQDLLTCGLDTYDGCKGGVLSTAWKYWMTNGIVTGGGYNSHIGCRDYSFPECSHYKAGPYPNCTVTFPTPPCIKQCQNGYEKTYNEDKHFGKEAYAIPEDEKSIMTELFIRGPVEASLYVYADFVNYITGVYQHVDGALLGGHAVKIIGWGLENKIPYWLVVNSWNVNWGDHGYFKILRGSDECGIESSVVAGLPK